MNEYIIHFQFDVYYIYSIGMFLNSGTYLLTYSPVGSSLRPNFTGQAHTELSNNFSNAELETHIQLPAQTDL